MRKFLLLFVLLCYGTYLSAHPDTTVATIKTDTIPCTDSVRLTMQTSGDGIYYLWSTGDTTQSIIVTQPGIYTCIVKDANLQVTDEAKADVTVPKLPKVDIFFSNYLSDTLRAFLIPYQEQSYTWYKDGEVIANGDDWALALKGSGLYTAALTDMNGCTYKASYKYVDTFNYSLAMKIQVSPCDSNNWLFQASVVNLKPGDSISMMEFYFPDSGPVNKNTWHTFAAPGTYNVSCYLYTASKRYFSGRYTVVVPDKGNAVTANISQHFDTLSVSTNGLDSSFLKYKWTRDLVEIPDTGRFIIPTVAGNYAVAVYTSLRCGAAANYDYRPLAVSLDMAPSTCDSTTWRIAGEIQRYPSGSPIVSNIIDYGDGSTGESGRQHTYAAAGVYNVTATITTAEGRKVAASGPLVVPGFSLSIYLKSGVQDTIFAKPDNRDPSYYTFKWLQNDNIISGADYYYFIPATSGKYVVYVSTPSGCVKQLSINYTKPATVIPTVGTNGRLQLAADFDTVTFNNDNVFNIELAVRHEDSRMLTEKEVISLGAIKGTDPTNLSVSIPDSLACASNYVVRVVSSSPFATTNWSGTFAIINQPAQPVIKQVGDSLFTSSIYDLQWYKDGVAISGATTAAIRARANGSYKVAALNGTGCSSLSDARAVVITAITNVSLGSNTVSAYPNPSEGPVYLKFGYPLTQKVTVKVYNLQGAVVYTTITSQQQQLLQLSALPKGFYLVEVSGYGTRKVLTIVLQ